MLASHPRFDRSCSPGEVATETRTLAYVMIASAIGCVVCVLASLVLYVLGQPDVAVYVFPLYCVLAGILLWFSAKKLFGGDS